MAWDDIAKTETFGKMSDEERQALANQYFDEKVANQIPEEDRELVRNQFITEKLGAKEEKKGLLARGVDYVKDKFSPERIKQNVKNNAESVEKVGTLASRSLADIPMGVTQAAADISNSEDFLPDIVKSGLLAASGNDQLAPEDFKFSSKEVSQSIAEETKKTDDLAKELGTGGDITRGVTQGLQTAAVAGPLWVKEGAGMLMKLGSTAAWNTVQGAGIGAVQPSAALEEKDRNKARLNNAITGGVIGATVPTVLEGSFMTANAVRKRITKKGAEELIAKEIQTDLAKPTASTTSDELATRLEQGIGRDKRMSYTVPGAPEYKRTTNEIADIAELDKYNKEANQTGTGSLLSGATEREELLKNQMDRNKQFRKSAIDNLQDPNATTENIEAASRKFLDEGVDRLNNVYDDTREQIVKANPKLTTQQANEEAGKYIKDIYQGFSDKIKESYKKVSGVNAQATPAVQAIKKAAEGDESMQAAMLKKNGLSKLLEAKSPSQITNIEDVVQAKADVESLIKQKDALGDDVSYVKLVKLKNNISDFLDNHPNEEIRAAIQEADGLYKNYKEALRRGGFNDPGVGSKIEGFIKSDKTVVNESQLPSNFLPEGADGATEPAKDLQRLTKAGEEQLGIKDTGAEKIRNRLYADLKTELKENKAEGNVETWFKKHGPTFNAFPELQKEFKNFTENYVQGNPKFGVAGKYQYKDAGKAFKSVLSSPEEASTVVELAKEAGDNGKALKDLKDQFKQYIKDTTSAGPDSIKNTSKIAKFFDEGTSENKVARELFQDADEYEYLSTLSKMLDEGTTNRTLTAGSAKGDSRGFQAAEGAESLAGSSLAGGSVTKAGIVINMWKQLANKGRAKVLDEFTRNPEYAIEILKKDLTDPSVAEKVFQSLQGLSSKTGITATVTAKDKATKGQTETPPKYTPNDLKLMDKKAKKQSSLEVEPDTKSTPTGTYAEKVKDPIQKNVVSKIEKKAKEKGIDADLAITTANAESKLGLKAGKNPKSSAEGLFQFIDSTAKDVAKKIGIKNVNKSNNDHSIDLGIQYLKDNIDDYTKTYKKKPKNSEVYAMHVLGPAGFKLINDNVDKRIPAHKLVGEDGKITMTAAAKANRKFFVNKDTKKAKTPKQVLASIEEYYESNRIK